MIKALRHRLSLSPLRSAQPHPLSAHDQHKLDCTSLCCAKSGSRVCITEMCGCEHEAAKLRDLGVREGAVVTVVRHGNPLLVRVDGARFGIGEAAAMNVLCEYVTEAGDAGKA
jgi:Fe2+ transport system protein FeoA